MIPVPDDPLADFYDDFAPAPSVHAYLDGNSLGRPLRRSRERMAEFIDTAWSDRLIRGWDDEWFDLPVTLGDRIADVVLGAAPGQCVVGDSTSVMLYKLIHGYLTTRPDRTSIIIERGNFPTDRFLVESIAHDLGRTVRYVDAPDASAAVDARTLTEALDDDTALVVLSHVDFRSAALCDMAEISAAIHARGARVLWDLCHSAGVVPVHLDACEVDLAVGCTYKYLNGGPGSPAFAYVNHTLVDVMTQPITGWMGSAHPFAMGSTYQPAPGMRRFISGTPAVMSMLAMQDMLDAIERAGIDAIRAKSVALTDYAVALYDERLAPHGVALSSPRDAERRGSHITVEHPRFGAMVQGLWDGGVIPDFRPPQGLRLGMSPLSTRFSDVEVAVDEIARRVSQLSGTS